MSDDPQTFQFPDPAEQPEEPQENLPGLQPGDLPGPVDDERKPAPGTPTLEPDILSEIRQSLEQEEEQSRRTSTTGRLIQRITGSLKRVTGPLGRTGPLSKRIEEEARRQGNPPSEGVPIEMPDDFLSGRLEGTTISEQPVYQPEIGEQDVYQPSYGEAYGAFPEEEESLAAETDEVEEPDLTGDEPISLLDSGAIAALGKAEEDALADESGSDWMAEIRSQTAEMEEQAGEKPVEPGPETPPPAGKRRGFTDPLRSFITGVLGGESRRKQQAEEIPDDMLTGRLNRSMATGPISEQAQSEISELGAETPLPEEEELKGTAALRALLGEEPEATQTPPGTEGDRTATGSLKPTFFSDLDEYELETGSLNPNKLAQTPEVDETAGEALPDDRFDVFNQKLPEKPATGGLILDEPLDLTPEEEQLLWGRAGLVTPPEEVHPAEPVSEAEPPMFTEEEIWGQPEPAEPQKADREAWFESVQVEPEVEPAEPEQAETDFSELTDEDYARAYLTGLPPEHHKEKPPVNLMHQALEKSASDAFDPQELRAIALEGMVSEAPSSMGYAGVYDGEAAWGEEREPFSLKTWLAKRNPMEKFLLVEGLVAFLAVLVAVPFFIFIIAGGRVPVAAVQTNWLSPRPLPANIPYPVGITLPGGWSFPLQKSTFIKGEWRPAAAEWLEGTELRRVVALPWNRQTEAVIQTFKPGDKVQINLSNQDTKSYTVKTVERVSSRDISIFSDLSPSLVIVLYKEDSEERWVVECQPIR